ncbi:hypothetical protein RYX36_036662 [Vicia faba]
MTVEILIQSCENRLKRERLGGLPDYCSEIIRETGFICCRYTTANTPNHNTDIRNAIRITSYSIPPSQVAREVLRRSSVDVPEMIHDRDAEQTKNNTTTLSHRPTSLSLLRYPQTLFVVLVPKRQGFIFEQLTYLNFPDCQLVQKLQCRKNRNLS